MAVVSSLLVLPCEALSAPNQSVLRLASRSSDDNNNDEGSSNVSIQWFDPSTLDGEDDPLLRLLRDCRRTNFPANKEKWLDKEREFCAAKSVTDGKNLCAIAYDSSTETVVGSADITPKKASNVITNVFVTPDRRGEGLGERLMVEGIEGVLANQLPASNLDGSSNNNNNNRNAVLSLDVYTQNTAAFGLYQKLGYEPDGPVNAGTLALAKTLGANLLITLTKTVPVEVSETNNE